MGQSGNVYSRHKGGEVENRGMVCDECSIESSTEVVQTIPTRQRSEMKRRLCVALIEAKCWERTEGVIHAMEDAGERVGALAELGIALIEAKEWERVDRVLTTIKVGISAVEGGRR